VSLINLDFHFTFLSKSGSPKFLKPVLVATDKEIKKERPSKIHQFTGSDLVPLTLIIIASIANYSYNPLEKVA